MAIKRWRCANCNTDFEAEKGACLKCKIDPADNPRFAAVVHQISTIHFEPLTHVPDIGTGKMACDGKPAGGRMATGVPAVANCSACRATEAWKRAYAGEHPQPGEPAMAPGSDEPVLLKTEEGAIVPVASGGSSGVTANPDETCC